MSAFADISATKATMPANPQGDVNSQFTEIRHRIPPSSIAGCICKDPGERLAGGHWSISVQDSPNPNHGGRAVPDRVRAFMESNFGTYLTIAAVILGALAAISCLFLDCV
jgi:hypothetical protein